MTQASKLSEKLKQLREDSGMSQRNAARELGVAQSTVARWEAAKATPNISDRHRLASFYAIPISELNRLVGVGGGNEDGNDARDDDQERRPD